MDFATQTAVAIRAISAADATDAAELSRQLGYETSVETMRSRIERLCGNESKAAFVALSDGSVVGWIEVEISCHLQADPYAVIGGLVVGEDMRSRGIGRRLLSEAEDWSRQKGIPTMRVRSQVKREDAHRFYLREGYRQVKTSAVFEKLLPSSGERM